MNTEAHFANMTNDQLRDLSRGNYATPAEASLSTQAAVELARRDIAAWNASNPDEDEVA